MSYHSLYNPNFSSNSTLPITKSHSTTSSASSTSPKLSPYDSNFDLSHFSTSPSKKQVIPVNVEVHPRECAIIIHFATHSDADPSPQFVQRILDLKPFLTSPSLSVGTILNDLKSKYKGLERVTKPSQLEKAILQLQQRPSLMVPDSASRKSRPTSNYTTAVTKPKRAPSEEVLIRRVLSPSTDLDDDDEVASIEMIDEYIELLYEDLPEKLKSAKLLLSLALRQELLPTLVQNASLFSAMSRTLREDTKKNLDLMATLITFFHQFVKHRMYVPTLTEHKIGDLCMKLLDHELKRREVWAHAPPPTHLQQRQDVVLYHCVSILYHMGKEPPLQAKMAHRHIAPLLCEWMKPVSMVVPFLMMLSHYHENIEQLKGIKEPLVPKLVPLLSQQSNQIDTLKLFINLSHDRTWQEEMIRAGLVAVLVDIYQSADVACLELELLMYQLSTDDRTKSIFSYTPIMSIILKKVAKTSKSKDLSISLVALAINLSLHPNHAEKVVQEQGIPMLVKRCLKTQEYLAFKWLRTLAMHPVTHPSFTPALPSFIARYPALPPDHQVELLGILAHTRTPAATVPWPAAGAPDHRLAYLAWQRQLLPPTVPEEVWAMDEDDDDEVQMQLAGMPVTPHWVRWALQHVAGAVAPTVWERLDAVVDMDAVHVARFARYNARWVEKVRGGG